MQGGSDKRISDDTLSANPPETGGLFVIADPLDAASRVEVQRTTPSDSNLIKRWGESPLEP